MVDTNNPLELIKAYWPDFPITPKLMQEPTTDIVITFYERYLNTLTTNLKDLGLDLPHFNNPELDPTIELFRKIQYIYSIILRYDGRIKLLDFYNPTSKRINCLFKVAMHFLCFLDNISEEVEGLISEPLRKNLQQQHMEVLQVELREKIKKNFTKIGKNKGINEHVSHKLDKLNNFKILLEQELNTFDQIISEDDFHRLKGSKDQIANELRELSEYDSNLAKTLEIAKQSVEELETLVKELENLDYQLPVKDLQVAQNDYKIDQNEMAECLSKNLRLKDEHNYLIKEIENFGSELKRKKANFDNKKTELQEQLEKLRKHLQIKHENNDERVVTIKALNETNMEIAELEKDLRTLNQAWIDKYLEMKTNLKKAIEVFEEKMVKTSKYNNSIFDFCQSNE